MPEQATTGPTPTLPEPTTPVIPTINIAPAKGWPADARAALALMESVDESALP